MSDGASFGRMLARYSASSLLLRLFRLAYAYAKPKFLEPAMLGLWNLLYLIPTYATHLHLGAGTAMVYRLARHLGEGDEAAAERLKSTVYTFQFAYTAVLAVVLSGLAAFAGFEAELRAGLVAMALLITLIWYHEYQFGVLKGEQRFDLISRCNVLNGTVLAVIGIPLVWLAGIHGVFIGAVLTRAVVVVYLARVHPLRVRFGFDGRLLAGLIREGLPILGFTAGLVLLSTADRMIIGANLGAAAVGFYAVSMVAAEFILQIPVSARDMLEPKLMASLSGTEPERLWRDYFQRPLLNTAAYFPFLAAGVAFLGEDVLRVLLPRYVDSALPATLLCFGCYFLAMVHNMRGVLIARGWQLWSLPFQLLGVGLNVAVSMALIAAGWGIGGVALGSGLSYGVVYVLLAAFLVRRGPFDGRSGVRLIGATLLPFAVAAGLVGLFEWAVPMPGGLVLHVLAALGKLVAFGVVMAALIALLRRAYPEIRWLFRR